MSEKNLPSRSRKSATWSIASATSSAARSSGPRSWASNFPTRTSTGMVFFRNATDHHTIALMQAKEKNELPKRGQVGFDHMALEVATRFGALQDPRFLEIQRRDDFLRGTARSRRQSRRRILRSRWLQDRDLCRHGSDRHRRQKPAGQRVEPRDHAGRSGQKSAARRRIPLEVYVSGFEFRVDTKPGTRNPKTEYFAFRTAPQP